MKIINRVSLKLLYLLISLSTLTETIYSAALPKIADQLNTTGGVVQSSTTAYYIGFALGILTLGRLSDIYGRRPLILIGISIYIMATSLIVTSTNIEFFIFCRLLQAYGASVGSVIAQSMARDSYKDWELSYVYASIGILISVIPTIGSALGGYIAESFESWRAVFIFLVALSSLMLVTYIKYLPETNPNIGKDNNANFWLVFKSTMNDSNFLRYAFIVGMINAIYFGFFIQAPFIFIEHLGMKSSTYGKLFIFLAIASFCSNFATRYMVKKYISTVTIRKLGFTIGIVGAVLLLSSSYLLQNSSSINHYIIGIFIPMCFLIIAQSIIIPMTLRHALDDYQKTLGSAGSIFGFIYYVITALMIFIISSFHSTQIHNFAYLSAALMTVSAILFYQTERIKTSL